MTIWKYPLAWGGGCDLQMPKGATVLCVQMQGMSPTIWALVNPEAPSETRTFEVFGTGWEMDTEGLSYVGTWQQSEYVWHLFERTR